MDIYLEITDGNAKGTRLTLKDGLTIGRHGCDLNLEDPKVSGKHAKLEARPDGSFWLVDLDSANGIRLGTKKIKELALDPGTTFRLGRTNLKVSGKKAIWREMIVGLAERIIQKGQPQKVREVLPLKNAMKLKFTRGLQVGQEWVLGYGPREIGAASVDLPLYEPGLPGKCFQVLVRGDETLLRVHEEASKKIQLNGKVIESAYVRAGDVLEIGNTRIEISFVG